MSPLQLVLLILALILLFGGGTGYYLTKRG